MSRSRRVASWVFAAIGLTAAAVGAQPIAFAADTEDTDDLYRLDLGSGAATFLGGTVVSDVEGVALRADGTLFGVSDAADSLVTCDTGTGACAVVGSLGVSVADPGVAFACDGNLYLSTEGGNDVLSPPGDLYRVDTTTGLATLVGSLLGDFDGHSLAQGPASVGCPSGMYALDGNGNGDQPRLGCVDLGSGAVSVIGASGVVVDGQPAIDFDASGVLWMVENDDGSDLFTVDPVTGLATDVGDVSPAQVGFDALAIQGGFVCLAGGPSPVEIPAVSGWGLWGLLALLGVAGVLALRGVAVRARPQGPGAAAGQG